MRTLEIERAGAAFVPVLAEIHAGAFPPGLRWSAEAISTQIGMPGIFVLRSGGVGMLMARVAADEVEILTFGVVSDAQRQGIGTALLARAMACAAGWGGKTMFLEVDADNTPAIRLYFRAGFTVVGRRSAYYASGADALVLRAVLIASDAAKQC